MRLFRDRFLSHIVQDREWLAGDVQGFSKFDSNCAQLNKTASIIGVYYDWEECRQYSFSEASPTKKRLMIQSNPQTDLFKRHMRESLQNETRNSTSIEIAKHGNAYLIGDQIEMVYFIETGKIKLVMLSTDGKECMLAIHDSGDIFGELCLAGLGDDRKQRPRWKTRY